MIKSFWERGDWSQRATTDPAVLRLAQGDLLPDCLVPVVSEDFGPENPTARAAKLDLIVVTQSCDLANQKVRLAALCPVLSLADYEQQDPALKQKRAWEQVRQGRVEGLHLLGGRDDPNDNRQALVVDFRQIHSLPVGYLRRHAERLGARDRLASPFLEHFSQAFARFFMRVGLPSAIPAFR